MVSRCFRRWMVSGSLRRWLWAAMVCGCLAAPRAAAAQIVPATPADPGKQVQEVRDELARLKREFDAMRQQYDLRITQLEQRIGDLAGPSAVLPFAPAPTPAVAPVASGTAVDPATAPAPPVSLVPKTLPPPDPPQAAPQMNMAGASKAFNPDTSVIANFVGAGGKNPLSDQPSLLLSEAEVSFQAVVDPYAKADFFLSAGPEGLNIEEGYLTFTTLPGGLLFKVGKMRAQFGKVNTLHTHAMPTADRPLVTGNLVGGEDGISDNGLSLSKLIPNGFMYLEATGEVYQGNSAAFHSNARSRLNYVGRLRGYRDLTEGTNLDVGGSVAVGPTDFGEMGSGLNKTLIGFDATFRYRPLRRAIYKKFQARAELVWSRQDLPGAPQANAFGFYGLGEYQFARRWYVGARYDQSGHVLQPTVTDKGGSYFMTYWPSEFSQIRGQVRRTNYGVGVTANEFLFQFNFAIGAHGAHVF